jgi:hypothetical protein
MWSRGQAFSVDFVAALFIFLLAVTVLFARWIRTVAEIEQTRRLNELVDLAYSASHVWFRPGVPERWSPSNIVSLGLQNDHQLNQTKIRSLWQLGYERVRELLGLATYEFYFELTDVNGSVTMVGGIVNPPVAYFASEDPQDIVIRDMLNGSGIVWDFYWAGTGSPPPTDARYVYTGKRVALFRQMIANLSGYGTVITEDPHVRYADLTVEDRKRFATFVNGGGIYLHIQHLEDLIQIFGPDPSGPPSDDGTIVTTDEILPFVSPGTQIEFEQATETFDIATSPIPLKVIAEVTGDPTRCIICKWFYGDGIVYYMPDASEIEFKKSRAIEGLDVVGALANFGREPVRAKNIVKIDRMSILDGQILFIQMVVWE